MPENASLHLLFGVSYTFHSHLKKSGVPEAGKIRGQQVGGCWPAGHSNKSPSLPTDLHTSCNASGAGDQKVRESARDTLWTALDMETVKLISVRLD